MSVDIYVQARIGSTRLPGKVMKKIMDKPLLEYQLERLKQVKEADAIVILTSTDQLDDSIAEFCKNRNLLCLRGSNEDVLDRYYQAARERKSDVVVRVTGDCPLIDPQIVDEVIRFFKNHSYDYVSNGIERTYPRGLDVEVFSFKALEEAWKNGKRGEEREHVTPYIYRHPELFLIHNISLDPPLDHYRWTVDTPEDFELVKKILEALYPNNPRFLMKDVLELLDKHPSWMQINAHIEQKALPPLT